MKTRKDSESIKGPVEGLCPFLFCCVPNFPRFAPLPLSFLFPLN